MRLDSKLLIKARAKAGLTQAKLATKAGISAQQLGRLERGVATPRPTTVYKLADGLGVDVSEITKEDS